MLSRSGDLDLLVGFYSMSGDLNFGASAVPNWLRNGLEKAPPPARACRVFFFLQVGPSRFGAFAGPNRPQEAIGKAPRPEPVSIVHRFSDRQTTSNRGCTLAGNL